MRLAFHRLLLACLSCVVLPIKAQTLTIAISSAETLPLAKITNDVVTTGILKELGDAIGAHYQRNVTYQPTPRKRLISVFEGHSADLLCGSNPAWLKGKFQWSQPIFSNTGLLVSNARVKPPQQLSELSSKPIGTISGYVYTEFSEAMGKHFKRDDAPNMTLNIRKFFFGRFDYAAVDELSYLYLLKREKPKMKLNKPMITSQYQFYCAISPQSSLSTAQVNHAITALQKSGKIQMILDGYR